MKTLSDGSPSNLRTYKAWAGIFGEEALAFIQSKIDESPSGEDEEVLADEAQMFYLLASL